MRARIRALERKLARQIAEIVVEPIVEQIIEAWPDPDDAESEVADSPGTVEAWSDPDDAESEVPESPGSVEAWPDPDDVESEVEDSPGSVEDPPRRNAPAPDTLVILDRLREARIFLPTALHAIAYLDQCWRDRKKPRVNHILNRLLPWLCPSPIPYGYRT